MFSIDFSSISDESLLPLAKDKLTTGVEEWEKDIWQFIADWVNPSITSIKVFTSGSTGRPKQIEHTKQTMLNSATITCRALNIQPGSNALLCLPANKIAGMMMIVRSMHCKMSLYCIKPSAAPLKELNEETRIDFAAFTPMQLHGIKKDFQQFSKVENIEKIILGGENISAELLQIVSHLSNEVYATFGMTETISHIALKRLSGKNADKHFKLLRGVKISTDENNRLVIKAPHLGQPNLTTNDIVQIFSEKQFDWHGRIDNVINSGGIKIHPEEIEQKLHSIIKCPFFITSLPDERTGEKLVLAVEGSVFSDKNKEELAEYIGTLQKLQHPKAILLFEQFARTENGKIKRKETLLLPYKIQELR